MFNTIDEAVSWIESVKKFGDKLDLSRMELACSILGNPEKKLPVIHIAGTNGKGSTVSYLKHILLEAHYNVGTFTSPYIVRFNERITYNNNDISNEELLQYINEVKELHDRVLDKHNQVITFFELITLISFMYFRDLDVDFVLYEVGLGGSLDATNVVSPLITLITSISFDHMGVLGNTLEEIALNKLGIVKENAPLVTAVDDVELLKLFRKYTDDVQSDLHIIDEKQINEISYGSQTNFIYNKNDYSIKMLGTHQVKNAVLAIEVINQLSNMGKLSIDLIDVQHGLIKTFWPGRLERFGNVILDGAHNVGGVQALKDSMNVLFKDHYIKVLFTSMADKEYKNNIEIIESIADEIHFTTFDYPRCETAVNLFEASNHNLKFIQQDAIAALNELKELKDNEILLVTGSLYFISYIRKAL